MIRAVIASFLLLSFEVLAMAAFAFNQDDDRASVVQTLLHAPQLAEYFHFAERPERLPLKITSTPSLQIAPVAGGQTVHLVGADDRQALAFTRIDLTGDKADVQFRYSPEGITGRALLSRSGPAWNVISIRIGETD